MTTSTPTGIVPVKYGTIGWVFEEDDRLKPLEIEFFDKQMDEIFEKDVELNRFIFRHPMAVALVKLSNRKIRVLLIDTTDPVNLERLRPELLKWYTDEGIRCYSLKKRFDQDGFIATPLPLDETPYDRRTDALPDPVGEWQCDIPLSMSQLKVDVL